MAKFCGKHFVDPMLKAMDEWKQKCLLSDKAMFTDEQLWTIQYLSELDTHFIQNPDQGSDDFLTKFQRQLENTSQGAKKLAGEMMWIILLFPSQDQISTDKKREIIKRIYDWSKQTISDDHKLLSDQMLCGIGSSGTSYITRRPDELSYLINLITAFKKLPQDQKYPIVSDPWKWADWLEVFDKDSNRQLRHMLSFFLFPDYYERIASGNHKCDILKKFQGKNQKEINTMSWKNVDEGLYKLRLELQKEYGTDKLDYYNEPLSARWETAEQKIIGLIASDGLEWKDKAIDELKKNERLVMWWDSRPSGTTETLTGLREKLENDGFFYFYFTRNGKVGYRARITDFSEANDYPNKKWEGAAWYEADFSNYKDEDAPRNATVAYLMNEMVHINPPLSPRDFVYYKDFKEPTQNNVQPICKLKTESDSGESKSHITPSLPSDPTNIIYYGPPGCGKTYKLLNEILPRYKSTHPATSQSGTTTLAFIEGLSWWETVVATMIDLVEK
jgi:5-methylcytosine-specific restriction enzyme B